MSDEPDHDWLAWSLRDAREKVASWPEWKREAFRVLPDDAPERRDGGATMTDETDPIEAWARLDEGATPEPWEAHRFGLYEREAWSLVAAGEDPPVADDALREPDARLIATDRTVRPELVAIVRAAEEVARVEGYEPSRVCSTPHSRLRDALDAFRAKLRETMGER